MTDGASPPPHDPTAILRGARVVLGVSGGIAAYKAPLVARHLLQAGAEVDTILTRGATRFVGSATFEGLTGRTARTEVWEDIALETHVALGREAMVVAIYPATAHVLAKAAAGLGDDLLTTTLLAATCPVVVAPAMHTEMWNHDATRANVARLRERGVTIVGPDDGALMGGDTGPGRAVDPGRFVAEIARALASATSRDLAGRVVVVTAGGTREPIDPVRYLGNRSSGKMGFAIAAEAARRGAIVHLVAAPTHLTAPDGVSRHDVTTAVEMRKAVVDLASDADVIVKAAAVADFRPSAASDQKLKKADGVPRVELERNPDILAELGEQRRASGVDRPLLVGFAAETEQVEEEGRAKLERKGADLLIVNDVSAKDAGFEVDTNRVLILGRDGTRIEVPLTTKRGVASRVLDEVATRLS